MVLTVFNKQYSANQIETELVTQADSKGCCACLCDRDNDDFDDLDEDGDLFKNYNNKSAKIQFFKVY